MAENDNPIGSLMDTAIDLGPNEEILEDIEIEALANGLDFERPPVEGIEIIEEDDGGVVLDFDPRPEVSGRPRVRCDSQRIVGRIRIE